MDKDFKKEVSAISNETSDDTTIYGITSIGRDYK